MRYEVHAYVVCLVGSSRKCLQSHSNSSEVCADESEEVDKPVPKMGKSETESTRQNSLEIPEENQMDS